MDSHFLAAALRKKHQLRRRGHAERVLQQRAHLAAQRAARNIRQAEGVLDDRIIGAANFERAFAGSDVQAGFAVQVARQNQFPDELQFGLSSVCAHISLPRTTERGCRFLVSMVTAAPCALIFTRFQPCSYESLQAPRRSSAATKGSHGLLLRKSSNTPPRDGWRRFL